MTKGQLIAISACLLLFVILYFGLDTKSQQQTAVEKSRAFVAESTGISSIKDAAQQSLTEEQRTIVALLEQELAESTSDSVRIANLRSLSGRWYQFGQPAVAGYYAQQLAELAVEDEEAWSIAGTTYVLCIRQSQEEKVKQFCANRAATAFENAISLNPGEVAHRVNLALTNVEYPPKDNPMKGILQLRELDQKYPQNPIVLSNLGRLAIQTGQYDKALERLEAAVAVDPENNRLYCLLERAYEGAGNQAKAAEAAQKCQQ